LRDEALGRGVNAVSRVFWRAALELGLSEQWT